MDYWLTFLPKDRLLFVHNDAKLKRPVAKFRKPVVI
jgi:hypothetical protein